jgi:putative membrane protein
MLYIKALHIIFVVTWFAGLFYIVRLFIYHREAFDKSKEEQDILFPQYQLMTKRLWTIITWPSMILTIIFGTWLLTIMSGFLSQGWMHLKLGFIVLLIIYHLKCHQIYKQLQNNQLKWNSTQLRIFNEVATILLFSIVFLVVLKNTIGWIFGVLGIVGLSVLLMVAVRWYKKLREK